MECTFYSNLVVFVFAAANELGEQGVLEQIARVDRLEEVEGRADVAQLLAAGRAVRHMAEHGLRDGLHDADLIGEGGVELPVGLVLEGADAFFFEFEFIT